MADAVQTAIYKLQMDSSQFEASGQTVQVTTTRIGNEFEKLEAKLDRNVAIEIRRRNAIEQANRVAQEEGVGAQRTTVLIDQLNDKYDQQINKLNQVGQAAANQNRFIGVATGGYRNFGNSIQQAGFQVGDFAVQIASGQGALRAFIQQGTQFVSMFGPGGAIIGAIGAVIGAIITFALRTDDASTATKTLTDEQKLLKVAMGEVNEQIIKNSGSLSHYLSAAQDVVNAQLAGQGMEVKNLLEQRNELQSHLNILLSRDFQGESRIAEEKQMQAQIDILNSKIEVEQRILSGLAQESVRMGRLVPTFGESSAGTSGTSVGNGVGRGGARSNVPTEFERIAQRQKELQEEEIARQKKLKQAYELAADAQRRREETSVRAEREELQRLGQLNGAVSDLAQGWAAVALGTSSWKDIALQSIEQISNAIINMLNLQNTGGQSGLGGLFSSIFTSVFGAVAGGGSVAPSGLPYSRGPAGFAAGGDFTVGGSGGTDSKRVSFMATPGERVSIRTPSQASANGNVTVINNYDFRNAIVDQARIRSQIEQATPGIVSRSTDAVLARRGRGGNYADRLA